MNKAKSIVKEKVIYAGKTFEITKKYFKNEKLSIEFEIARRSPGVRLIIVKKDKILLTKEFRPELNDYDYRLPGGKVFDSLKEYKTTISKKYNILKYAEEAAKKECAEETGLIPKRTRLFQTTKAGLTVEWDLFYFVVDDFDGSVKNQKLEDDEIIHPVWKTFEETKKMCLNNKVKEDRSVGVILRFLLQK